MIIRNNSTFTLPSTFIEGSFNHKNGSYYTSGTEGSSRFGNIMTAYGTDYVIGLSHDGVGCSIFDDKHLTSPDGLGKVWYIKDLESGETWNPVLIPLCKEYDEYQTTYLPGEATVYNLKNKIGCSLTISAIPGETCERWTVRIDNNSAKERILAFVCYVDAFFESVVEAKYSDSIRTISMCKSTHKSISKNKCVFLSSSIKPVAYLIPKNCQNEERSSKILLNDDNPNVTADDPLLSYSIKLDIPIEGSAEFSFFFGTAKNHNEASTIVNRIKPDTSIINDWERITSSKQINTPDKILDALVNTWLPYEAFTSSRKSFSIASKLNPLTISDKLRSLESISSSIPEDTRMEILDFASNFDFNGNFIANDFSIVRANPFESLYLIFAVFKYILETNDNSILNEIVNSCNGNKYPLYEYCKYMLSLCVTECTKNTSKNNIKTLKKGVEVWKDISEDNSFDDDIIRLESRTPSDNNNDSEFDYRSSLAYYILSICPTLSDNEIIAALKNVFETNTIKPSETQLMNLVMDFVHEYMFGVNISSEGIDINPHLPLSWESCEYKRKFRGDVYDFHFNHAIPGLHSTQGLKIFIDKEPIEGCTIPLFNDHETHRVDVIL